MPNRFAGTECKLVPALTVVVTAVLGAALMSTFVKLAAPANW